MLWKMTGQKQPQGMKKPSQQQSCSHWAPLTTKVSPSGWCHRPAMLPISRPSPSSALCSAGYVLGKKGGSSLVAQLVKNPPEKRETWVWSLGWEDPLEKGTITWIVESHGVTESRTWLKRLSFAHRLPRESFPICQISVNYFSFIKLWWQHHIFSWECKDLCCFLKFPLQTTLDLIVQDTEILENTHPSPGHNRCPPLKP